MAGLRQLIATWTKQEQEHAVNTNRPEVGTPWIPTDARATQFTQYPLRIEEDKARVIMARNGDIPRTVWLVVTMTRDSVDASDSDSSEYPAERCIKRVRVSCADEEIDTLTSGWLRMYDEIFRPADGQYARIANFGAGETTRTFHVPLPLWFQDGHRPLLMVCLAYHEVRLDIEFADVPGVRLQRAELDIEWLFLNDDERRRVILGLDVNSVPSRGYYRQVIEQTQSMLGVRVDPGKPTTLRLPFEHHVRFLALDAHIPGSSAGVDLESIEVSINGHVMYNGKKPGYFFNQIRPYQYLGKVLSRGKHLLSFCMHPKDIEKSSGCINFSKLDNVTLVISSARVCVVDVYARSYNEFRYVGGMASAVYDIDLVTEEAPDFPEAVAIQAAWRGYAERRRHEQRMHEHYAPGGKGAQEAIARLTNRV
jgi:hypothetical protein